MYNKIKMKLILQYKKRKKTDKCFIEINNIKYNLSEGHLYTNSLWFNREKYLRYVANVIGNGYPIVRDGTKTDYNSSFKNKNIIKNKSVSFAEDYYVV